MCKCASRHNGVHFFDITTSKSAPNPSVFYTFDFEVCFAPQLRALFRHLNFQSGPNMWCFNILTLASKCASHHNSVQFFISHLASWLRTHRFSEPTFRPSGATNHCKNAVFRAFLTFSRTWIFFLLRLALFWSSSFFFSSLPLPSSPSLPFPSLLLLFSDSSHLCFHLSILSEVWLLNFLRPVGTIGFGMFQLRDRSTGQSCVWRILGVKEKRTQFGASIIILSGEACYDLLRPR